MSEHLRTLLTESAAEPADTFDVTDLRRRGSRIARRRRIALIAGIAAAVLLVTAGVVAAVQTLSSTRDVEIVGQPSEPTLQDTAPPACPDVAEPPEYTGMPPGWQVLPAPPHTTSDPAAIATDGSVVVFGSNQGGDSPGRQVSILNIADGSWSCGTPAPSPIVSEDVAWTGALAYAWTTDGAASYDPDNDLWIELPPPPDSAPDTPLTVTWARDELLVWASDRRGAATAGGVAYNPRTQTWREIPDAPITINQGQAVWTGSELVVYGSQLDGGNRATTSDAAGAAYDPQTDTWRQIPPFDLSPQATSIAWTGQTMLAWDYELRAGLYDPETDNWTRLADLPLEFSECYPDSAVMDGGQVFAWFCGQAALLDETTWTQVTTPVSTTTGPDGEQINQIPGNPVATIGRIYLVGAPPAGDDPATWTWTPGE